MDLHRAGTEGDWVKVKPEKRNRFQKIAAKTGGIVTPGNICTLTGLGLVFFGVADVTKGRPVQGFIKMAAGKTLDYADGKIAALTQTKSPLGEKLDASTDKVIMLGILPRLVKTGAIPILPAAIILGQNAANAAGSMVGAARGAAMHASATGKWTNGIQGTEIGAYTAAYAARERGVAPAVESAFTVLGTTQAVISTALGLRATYELWRDALASTLASKPDAPPSEL